MANIKILTRYCSKYTKPWCAWFEDSEKLNKKEGYGKSEAEAVGYLLKSSKQFFSISEAIAKKGSE